LENEEVYINDLDTAHLAYPNLDDLFAFLLDSNESEEEVNVTAAFYFYQIVNSLINSCPQKLLSYVYSHKVIINVLIEKSGICAYRNLLSRFLNIYENDEKEHINFKFLKHRFTLYRKIFQRVIAIPEIVKPVIQEKFPSSKANANLAELLSELIKEQDKIVDSSYFIENILFEKSSVASLLNSLVETPYQYLLDLASVTFQKMFEETNNKTPSKSEMPSTAMINFDQFKIESDEEDRDFESPSFSKKNKGIVEESECIEENEVKYDPFGAQISTFELQNFASNNPMYSKSDNPESDIFKNLSSDGKNSFHLNIKKSNDNTNAGFEKPSSSYKKIARFEINEDSLQVEIDCKAESLIAEEKEGIRENQNTAETSNECTMNLDLELYDPEVLKVSEIVDILVVKIVKLKEKLLRETSTTSSMLSSQRSIVCFSNKMEAPSAGNLRINLLRLFNSFLKIQIFEIKNALIKDNFIDSIFNLYKSFPKNNILHFLLTEILETLICFLVENIKYEGYGDILQAFITRLSKSVEGSSKPSENKKQKTSHLYIGFINKLGNTLNAKLNELDHYISAKSSPEWKSFSEYLEKINKVINNDLFNQHKRKPSISKGIPDNFELSDIKISKIIGKSSGEEGCYKRRKSKGMEIEYEEEDEEMMHSAINQELLENLIESMTLEQNDLQLGSYDDIINYEEEDVNVEINYESTSQAQKDHHKSSKEELADQLSDIPIVEDFGNSFSGKDYWNTSKVGYNVDEILKTFKQ
jgi:hypothetical protein